MTSNGSKYYQAHLWSLGQEDQQSRQVLAATLALIFQTGALCVEMGFYMDISLESRCNVDKCLSSLCHILLVFEVPYRPQGKGMPGKN